MYHRKKRRSDAGQVMTSDASPRSPGATCSKPIWNPASNRVMPALGPDERAVAGSGCLRGELSVEYRLQLPAEKLPGADRHADPLPGQREALPRGIARDEEWADDGVAEARGQEPAVILTGRQAELRKESIQGVAEFCVDPIAGDAKPCMDPGSAWQNLR